MKNSGTVNGTNALPIDRNCIEALNMNHFADVAQGTTLSKEQNQFHCNPPELAWKGAKGIAILAPFSHAFLIGPTQDVPLHLLFDNSDNLLVLGLLACPM